MSVFSILSLLIGIFGLLLFVIVIGLYVLLSVGLYGLAKNANIQNEWFAFIPILRFYIIGKILKEIKIGIYTVTNLGIILPIATIAIGFLLVIPVLGPLITFTYLIFIIMVIYKLFKRYKGDQAVIFTVLSVVLPFLWPIFVFNLRNATPLITEEEIVS